MKKKVLIVDDDTEMLGLMENTADSDRFECISESRSDQCLKTAEEIKPDVIVLDLMMPKISGYGILRELKKRPHLNLIPVIVVSNLRSDDIVREAMSLGASGYFSKAEGISQLFRVIQEYI